MIETHPMLPSALRLISMPNRLSILVAVIGGVCDTVATWFAALLGGALCGWGISYLFWNETWQAISATIGGVLVASYSMIQRAWNPELPHDATNRPPTNRDLLVGRLVFYGMASLPAGLSMGNLWPILIGLSLALIASLPWDWAVDDLRGKACQVAVNFARYAPIAIRALLHWIVRLPARIPGLVIRGTVTAVRSTIEAAPAVLAIWLGILGLVAVLCVLTMLALRGCDALPT